jgi:ABC-type branched-subunit amino acid transport system ATPase component
MQADAVLALEDLAYAFGGVQAVDGCTFDVQRGRVTALIGPNGAGKTTLVNVVAGALRPQRGRVFFRGVEITGWAPHRVARQGLIRTFQISRELGRMTVLENMLVASPGQAGERLFTALFRPAVGAREDRRLVERALAVLDTFELYALRHEYARNLSGGQKRLLEIARAVMAAPHLLLLDEPMAGVNPALIDRLIRHIRELRAGGLTVLMVEHNLHAVEQLCDHVVVMALGRVLATGLMADLRRNEDVVRAYLGGALVGRAAG